MQAGPHTFQQLFSADVQYEVPVFQRQYVWTKTKQLAPLWDDVAAVAERAAAIAEASDAGVAAIDPAKMEGHFLGAIVLDDQTHRIGVTARPVIDGQQRLTTLQLLISAIREVAVELGLTNQERALSDLLFHPEHQIEDAPDHHRYRVWPTLHDREAFRSVLDSHGIEAATALGYGTHRIASAEAYFREQVEAWVREDSDGGAEVFSEEQQERRLRVLVRVVERLLRVVVIGLDETDNAQLSFETLNARGEELLAAELVKNFLFQHAERPEVDIEQLYASQWRKFEEGAWRDLVGTGREKRPRVEQYLFQWLTMQTATEVSPKQLFPPFRRWMKDGELDAINVLRRFSSDGDVYLSFEQLPDENPAARFFRRLQVLDTTTPIPLVLWLYTLGDARVSGDSRVRALRAIESWLVRRALCLYTTRGYNRLMLDILNTVKGKTPDAAIELDQVIIAELQDAPKITSRLWPSDQEVRDGLLNQPIYGKVNQRRLRMTLLAIEEVLHAKTGGKAEPVVPGTELHVEHLMPQAWEEHWVPSPPADVVEADEHSWRLAWIEEHGDVRRRVVDSLGNLTLLTGRLNQSVSNGPWADKRSSIDEFSNFRLNKQVVKDLGGEGWDESKIASRAAEMIEAVLETWPGPEAACWQAQRSAE